MTKYILYDLSAKQENPRWHVLVRNNVLYLYFTLSPFLVKNVQNIRSSHAHISQSYPFWWKLSKTALAFSSTSYRLWQHIWLQYTCVVPVLCFGHWALFWSWMQRTENYVLSSVVAMQGENMILILGMKNMRPNKNFMKIFKNK